MPPEEQGCLLTEPSCNPKKCREKTISIMFETFDIPKFFLGNSAVFSLYAQGLMTGIVLESGHGLTHSVPIFEGYALQNTIKKTQISGNDVTSYFCEMLQNELGFTFNQREQEMLREIKEKVCYVSEDYDDELRLCYCSSGGSDDILYELPDKTKISMKNQQFRAPEILFQPSIIGKDCLSIQSIIFQSIFNINDTVLQNSIYQNIVLSGGNTMFKGIENRLIKELNNFFPKTMKTKILADNQRNIQAWIGASVISSLSSFENAWIQKDEYEEVGPYIVHQKCF